MASQRKKTYLILGQDSITDAREKHHPHEEGDGCGGRHLGDGRLV